MDEINPEILTQLIASVQQSPKYAQIAPSLVERIAREELQKRSNFSESVKAVRSRLHQLTGAYLPTKVDYAQWIALFRDSAQDKHELCQRMLRLHASTAERLSFKKGKRSAVEACKRSMRWQSSCLSWAETLKSALHCA